jgi:hypothetical protein
MKRQISPIVDIDKDAADMMYFQCLIGIILITRIFNWVRLWEKASSP